MATQRKTTRGKTSSTRKPATAARPARGSGKPAHGSKFKGRTSSAARPEARSSAKPAAKPVAKPAAKPAAKDAARPVKVVGRPAVKGKPKLAVARRSADPAVRPLGVLPPERHDRSAERAAAPVPRPMSAPVRPQRPVKSPGAQPMSDKDYKEIEEKLLLDRQKVMKEMGHLETTVLKVNQRESAGDLSRYSFHMADAGTDAMEREKAFLLASAEGRILMEVNEALRRLYRGEFGDCEICGQPIGVARLKAMPSTRLCFACKEKEERAGRGAL
jgi:RNA polymerase-binding transcription factor DksA